MFKWRDIVEDRTVSRFLVPVITSVGCRVRNHVRDIIVGANFCIKMEGYP